MSMEVLTRHWEELSKKANYLNVALGTSLRMVKTPAFQR